jgi:hypothetical protein
MALGSTLPLTEISTRNISWRAINGGRYIGLTSLPPYLAYCLKIWAPQPLKTLWIYLVLYRDCFLDTLAKLHKAAISFIMSVHPFAWNSSAPAGHIFVKVDI